MPRPLQKARRPRPLELLVLERRLAPAIDITFGGGTLTIIGDSFDNIFQIQQDAEGYLLCGGVRILGNPDEGIAEDVKVSNTSQIILEGNEGNDSLSVDNDIAIDAMLRGGGGNDYLDGGGGGDLLDGGADHDLLTESADANMTLTSVILNGVGGDVLASINEVLLIGGDSANSIDISGWANGPITVQGGGGADHILGSPLPDTLDGGDGADTIYGEAGGDHILGGQEPDFLYGQDDNDTIDGGAGADTIDAGPNSNDNPDNVDGGTENDTIVGGDGHNILDGGDGDDSITGGDDDDALAGGEGNDTLSAGSATGSYGSNGLGGGPGNDLLIGGDRDDYFGGGDGDDTFEGGGGDFDSISLIGDTDFTVSATQILGQGTDTIDGGIESFIVIGGSGNNVLTVDGFLGRVTFNGRDGANDRLVLRFNGTVLVHSPISATYGPNGFGGSITWAGDKFDEFLLDGGAAGTVFDVSDFQGDTSKITLQGGSGTDTIRAFSDANLTLSQTQLEISKPDTSAVFTLTNFQPLVDRAYLQGGALNNRLDASQFEGPTTMLGGAGDDTLLGGKAPDSMNGGAGNDSVAGNDGDDRLTGGEGNDNLQGGDHDNHDTLIEEADANFTLTDTSLKGLGNDSLKEIETVSLTGGAGDNLFNVAEWSPSPYPEFDSTLSGGGGRDRFTTGNCAEFWVRDGGTSFWGFDDTDLKVQKFILNDFESAQLTGTANDNLFWINDTGTVTAFEDGIAIGGAGGGDRLQYEGDPGEVVLTSKLITISENQANPLRISIPKADVKLATITATGADSPNQFDISGWTDRSAILIGNGLDDTLVCTGSGIYSLHHGTNPSQSPGGDLTRKTGKKTAFFTLQHIAAAELAGGSGNDTFQIIDSGVKSENMKLTINGSGGTNDRLFYSYEPVSGAPFVHLSLEDTQLRCDSLREAIDLQGVEWAQLTGGSENNEFDVSFWKGKGLIDGGDGDDAILAWEHNGLTLTLSDDRLVVEDAANMTLRNLENADVRGQSSKFDLSVWKKKATIHGGGAEDLLIVRRDTDVFYLTDDLLAVGGAPTEAEFTLEGVEQAQLTSSGSANTVFRIGEWTGDATLTGGKGNDSLFITDQSNVVLAQTALSFGDAAAIAHSGLEEADIVGTASNDTLDASGFRGIHGTFLRGEGGDDILLGSSRSNEIHGGPGNDTIRGGAGTDFLYGESGADHFTTEWASEILDYNEAEGDVKTVDNP